jgi:NADH dehydrogenase (ubiquinone) 1 alpha subcomplex subunit 9
MDVAQALTNILSMPSLPGTLNLPGPSTLTYDYLLALLSTVTYNAPTRAPVVPKPIATLLARLAQNVWWPALSPDEVERRYIDDSDVPGDWDKVGVVPTEIEENALLYLRRYRSAYVSRSFMKTNLVLPSRWPPFNSRLCCEIADVDSTLLGKTLCARWCCPRPARTR